MLMFTVIVSKKYNELNWFVFIIIYTIYNINTILIIYVIILYYITPDQYSIMCVCVCV